MVLGTGAIALSWAFELSRMSEAKAALAAEQSTSAYSQVSRVLSAMCDAVINLDANMCISGGPENGVTKLQSLLMLRSSGVLHKPFVEMIGLEDQERFQSYMATHHEGLTSGQNGESDQDGNEESMGTQIRSLHLHLQDHFGLQLAVQLFCSALLDSDGKPMYLLGIREDTSAETAGLAELQTAQQEATSSSTSTSSFPSPAVIGNPADSTIDVCSQSSGLGDQSSAGMKRTLKSSSSTASRSSRGRARSKGSGRDTNLASGALDQASSSSSPAACDGSQAERMNTQLEDQV